MLKAMNTNLISYKASSTQAPTALIMLPGAKDKPQDFVDNHFIDLLQKQNLPIDVFIPNAHMDYYLEKTIDSYLHHKVVAPISNQGYINIWLLGISLGGFGALSYIEKYPGKISGAVLLAPFLGTRGFIAKVAQKGGIDAWPPELLDMTDDEHRVLRWLQGYDDKNPLMPKLYLAYGKEDRFAMASQLMENKLPSERCLSLSGGHDWATWQTLWKELLIKVSFTDS